MNKKRMAALAVAACLALGMLAGCGGNGADDAPQASQDGVLTPEEELQAALDREREEAEQAAQAELEAMQGNTKPAGEGANAENKGDGNGMAGLEGEDPDASPDGEDDGSDIPGGEYAYDGTYSLPDGIPDLTLEALGVPDWDGQPWVVINNNTPFFQAPSGRPKLGETYSSVDQMRRPGYALVCVNEETGAMADYACGVQAGTMSVPGWNRDAYPGIVEDIDASDINFGEPVSGEVTYIRRIVGSGLSSSDAGRRNTMVCTQYMGEYGLKTLEDAVKTYLQRTGRRVIYRVTPVFEGKEELARGAVVEAMSYGDSAADIGAGRDLCFCMFVYNVQPGVKIDYRDGSTDVDDKADPDLSTTVSNAYVLDTSRKQAHLTNCYQLVHDVSPAVQSYYYGTPASLVAWSYDWNACDCMSGDYVPPEVERPETDTDEVLDAPSDEGQ